jgi:hypothetical protein
MSREDPNRGWGGWRQRLATECEREALSDRNRLSRSRSPRRILTRADLIVGRDQPESQMALDLCMDWAWGDIKSPNVARYARGCIIDGCVHPILKRLAKLGGGGSSDNNVSAQLMNMLFKRLRGKNLVRTLEGSANQCMIDPHRLFSSLYELNPSKFAKTMGMDRDKCRSFWEDFFATRDGAEMRALHPHLRGKSPSDLETSLPLTFHVDAGPFSKKQSANVLSWSCLFAVGSELEIRYLISTWVKNASDQPEKAWAHFWDSLCLLASGKDSAGNALALDEDGRLWGGLFLFGLADMEAWVVEVGMTGYNHNEICAWCYANRSTLPWTNLGTSAAHLHHKCSNDEFLGRIRPGHGLLEWPGFNKHSPRLDTLHVCDYNGVSS